MNLIVAPPDSNYCGQACVAMAAGVSLDRACEVTHARHSGTTTREVVTGLRALGVPCADRARVLSRTKPVFPRRCMVSICTDKVNGEYRTAHWLLYWDGVMYDPRGCWPEQYDGWTITSYLEINS